MNGQNRVVVTHEILHTVGLINKYALAPDQPMYPAGFARPDQRPIYPQRKAELMAGRISLSKE